jgi:hypothetical protein
MLAGLKRSPIIERMRRAVQRDMDHTMKRLRKEVRQLSRHVEESKRRCARRRRAPGGAIATPSRSSGR